MFYFKVLVIILCLRISIASKKCTKLESCYDETEEKRILANPFLQEKYEDTSKCINATYCRENSNAHDSRDQHHSEGEHPACPNTDICQLMCLHKILNLTGPTGKRGLTGKPGPPGPVGPSSTNTSTLQGCKFEEVIKGLQGDPGLKGENGRVGLKGAPGLTGERGTPGSKGDRGRKGEPAEGGVFGPVGPPGPPGRDGIPGEKGDSSLPGDVEYGRGCFPGPNGRRGLRGDRGAPGALIIFMPSDQNLTDPQLQILNNYDDVSTILQRMVEGTGEKNNPVRTCSDLSYSNYDGLRLTVWIDPNGGDISDAIEVSCDLELGTCIKPIEKRSKNISFEAFDNSVWLSEINGGMQISYGDINHQIGFLQLLSSVVTQDISIHCQNTVVYYDNTTGDYNKAVQLMTWNDVVLFAKTGHPDHRYYNVNDNCSTSNFEWGKTTLKYNTDKAMRLPIMDVAILDYGVNKSFSVELGPVCFRN